MKGRLKRKGGVKETIKDSSSLAICLACYGDRKTSHPIQKLFINKGLRQCGGGELVTVTDSSRCWVWGPGEPGCTGSSWWVVGVSNIPTSVSSRKQMENLSCPVLGSQRPREPQHLYLPTACFSSEVRVQFSKWRICFNPCLLFLEPPRKEPQLD